MLLTILKGPIYRPKIATKQVFLRLRIDSISKLKQALLERNTVRNHCILNRSTIFSHILLEASYKWFLPLR